MFTRIAVALSLGLLSCSSCHRAQAPVGDGDAAADSDADGDVDSDADSDTDADTDTLVPGTCETALVPQCADTIYELPPIVLASEFGAGVVFVDVVEHGILAVRSTEEGTELMVIMRGQDDTEWGGAGVATLMVGDLMPQAISSSVDYPEQHFTVLACSGDDGSCELFGASAPNQEPAEAWPLFGGVLSADHAARRLGRPHDGLPVVVGDGVWLFAEEMLWELVPPGTGAPLNDAMHWIAVGDDGRYATFGSYGETYADHDVGTDSLLHGLYAWPGNVALAAADGTVGVLTIMPDLPEPASWIQLSDWPVIDVDRSGSSGSPLYALSVAGCVFAIDLGGEEEPCVHAVLPEDALAMVAWQCDDSQNVSHLTAEGLYGIANCMHFD